MTKTTSTPYGTVDQSMLQELQAGYDTNGILQAVDRIDMCRARLCEPDGIRDDLLRLHAMAHTVVNGARLTVAADETGIWEMADELIAEFGDMVELFRATIDQLAPLARLVPPE
ncbi:MAG TPA: Tn3 family transposase post-transcriptional regulator TnpC [Noviherbaspirillum sp.]